MANRQYRKFQKQAITIGGFILFTSVLWLALKLNSQYLVQHKINVKLIDSKTNVLLNAENDSVVFTFKSNGWRVMFPQIMLPQNIILESGALKLVPNLPYIKLSRYTTELKAALNYTNEIVSLYPDTLFLKNTFESKKKVPVLVDMQVLTLDKHTRIGTIKTYPDSVTVYGSNHNIEAIRAIRTSPVILDKAERDLQVQSDLSIDNTTISVSQKNVKIDIPVQYYTEYSIALPSNELVFINNKIVLHPLNVPIVFKSTLSNAQRIHVSDFELIPLEKINPKLAVQKVLFECRSKNPDAIIQRPKFLELSLVKQ